MRGVANRACVDDLRGARVDAAGGGLKTRECVVYLEDLDAKGLIELPVLRKTGRPRGRATSIHYSEAGEPRPEREGMLGDVAPVALDLVTTHGERGLWRELVERYHYLGHKVPYGAHLRYLVRIATPRREVAGCLQFSSPAWKIAARDTWLAWDDEARRQNLQKIVCNSRFLILPWLRIKGLASHVLGLSARVVPDDWEESYGVRPAMFETFVETGRYDGTCYRAANWIELGRTAGRGRQDREHEHPEPVKSCWVYPLESGYRRRLGAKRS
ncbi:MAG: DUF4338 domain-containing protein [Acidobacteria bacterium]|nr:DUF4338 domain-containing protein [Acidobacteriota bacterium]